MRRCWRSRHFQDVARRRASWGFFPCPNKPDSTVFPILGWWSKGRGRGESTPYGSALSKLPVINMKFAQNRHFYKVSTANITYHTGTYRRYGIWCRGEEGCRILALPKMLSGSKLSAGTVPPSLPSLSLFLSLLHIITEQPENILSKTAKRCRLPHVSFNGSSRYCSCCRSLTGPSYCCYYFLFLFLFTLPSY